MSAVITNRSHKTPSFSDQEIQSVASRQPSEIAEWVRMTAEQKGVSLRRRPSDKFARTVSRLSDAETNLDQIEELLVALSRSQVITSFQRGLIQVRYLR
jgi:hypothetical protein